MRFLPAAALVALVPLALAAGPSLAARAPELPVVGKWANPMNTLAVETKACAEGRLCGEIVWASDVALSDAKEAGVDKLIGTQLLQDYRPEGHGSWTGRVYVPDMGRTFSSRIKQTSPDTLAISGCLIGGFLCKTQVWHRVA